MSMPDLLGPSSNPNIGQVGTGVWGIQEQTYPKSRKQDLPTCYYRPSRLYVPLG
jgi:CMP-N-acetylneuraminic acid synthetase